MVLKIEEISEVALRLGEGPHWDARAQALYFIDLLAAAIHRYSGTGGHTKTKIDGRDGLISFVVPVEGHLDQFVVGMGSEFLVVQWDGAEGSPARVLRKMGGIDAALKTTCNDGKADPRGRLYTGTYGNGNVLLDKSLRYKGSLYRVEQGTVTKLDDKISISNGLAWDQRAKAMYYIDSVENKIRRYDYDVETGNISNLKYIFDFEKNNIKGVPDGMTIDADGNLWVAVFTTGCIFHISPGGQLLRTLRLPATQVTSCTFGGPDLDVLFVTTGYSQMEGPDLELPSGRTFKITGLGVKGQPNYNVKL